MNPTDTFKKLPGVLAFKRGHVISDALMFNLMENGEKTPLNIIRHGIRGTQNVVGKDDKDISNIQITETAKLDINTTTMHVRFRLSFLPIADSLHACAGINDILDIRKSIEGFLERAKRSEGLKEVACRYARNIANGRWLWRNRTIASEIQIEVFISDNKNEPIASFNAFKISTNNFDNYNADEIKLGEEIASQMRGDSSKSLLVEAKITLRISGAEVFPSQNYIENKPKGFARPLYKVGHPEPFNENDSQDLRDIRIMGQAAIRDQKIFNAIRTIDTWYPSFSEDGFPIPLEPKGANLEMQKFYRPCNTNGKKSAFRLFGQLNIIDPDSDDGMFCIASFDRGGVYSESDKAEKEKKAKVKREKDNIESVKEETM